MFRLSIHIVLSTICFFVFVGVTYAQYTPIVPIPGVDYNNLDQGMDAYLKTIYLIAISFAGMLAVAMLIWGGFQYVTSGGGVSGKQAARERIRNAIVGLLIILAAVALLRTINPKLTQLPALVPADQIVAPFQQRTQIVRPGEDSARTIQEQLDQCKNIIRYPDDTRCCNDGNTCNPPPANTSGVPLQGLDPNKNAYSAQEIIKIAEDTEAYLKTLDPEYEVLDLYTGQARPEEQLESECQLAAEYRDKEFVEMVVMNQVTASAGIRQISQRPLCIMK